MNNLKFRVWENAVGFEKFYYNMDDLFKNPSVIPSKIFNGEDKLLIINQWTGLKDKNGQDIYEDDFVEITRPKREVPDYFLGYHSIVEEETKDIILVIRDKQMRFYGRKPKWEFSAFEIRRDSTALRVIGNKYENPEFLA